MKGAKEIQRRDRFGHGQSSICMLNLERIKQGTQIKREQGVPLSARGRRRAHIFLGRRILLSAILFPFNIVVVYFLSLFILSPHFLFSY